ncbi:hypothetical protein NHF50_02610, partial [Flavobacterium sp. NRK F10]
MKQKITFILIAMSLFSTSSYTQTQFWSDTFEDTGAPSSGSRTPSIAEFSCGGPPATAYFRRAGLADIDLQSGTYSNIEGSKFWAAEDIDKGPTCTNSSISANQQVTWSGIDISGKTNLSFKGLFADNDFNGGYQGSSFGASQDFMAVEYRIDGGSWNRIIAIYANSTTSSSTFSVDTDGDLIGDGTALSYAFTELTANISGTGTTLDLRFNCFVNASTAQEIAIDNFRLLATPACTDPTVPTVTATTPVCAGNSSTLTISGTLNDATQWAVYTGSCGGTLIGTTSGSTFVVTPSSNTTYYVRGEGGCVTPGSCGTATVNVVNLSLSASSQTNVSCFGGTNGSATVSASGSTGYTYSWSPSGGTGTTATGLAAGTYTCTVTDANGCTDSVNFTITEPTVLALTQSSQTNIACNGGSTGAATVNAATGGAGGYTYNWTPGNPTGDGTTSVTGLTAGTWTCTVTDANGCTTSTNFTITEPTALALTQASQTDVACNGGSTGAATVNTATGGAGGYTYNWTPGNPTGDGTTSVTGLTAGTWTCTVTDANGCTTSTNFTITEPTALALTQASQTNIACNGGSTGAATVNTATGGAGGYTYNWTPGNPTGDGTTSVTGLTAG